MMGSASLYMVHVVLQYATCVKIKKLLRLRFSGKNKNATS